MTLMLFQVPGFAKSVLKGWRYRRLGRKRLGNGKLLKLRTISENVQTPTTTPALHQTQYGASVAPTYVVGDRVHAVLGALCWKGTELRRIAECIPNPLLPRLKVRYKCT